MPPPPAPGSRPPATGRDLDRELARAGGSRKLLPWALASALGGGAIAWAAGGGVRAAAAIAVVGLLFVLFLWTTSIARCPACGTRLRRGAGGGPRGGPADAARPGACAACGARS